MFDDEELEQIRDERDEWQGHVDRETVKKSRTSRKLLFGSLTTSMVMAVFLAFITISGSLAAGTLIGLVGVGGFFAQIEEIDNAEDIAIYPALGPTAACQSDVDFNEGPADGGLTGPGGGVALPQLRAEIGNLSIPNDKALTLTKDINLPDTFLTNLQTFRVEVKQKNSQGEVNINNAVLYLTGLEASQIEIQQAQIREYFSEQPKDSFFEGGTGQAVINNNARPGEFAIRNRPGTNANAVIKDAEARAHFVAFDQLDIDNLQLRTKYGTVNDPLPDVVSIDHSTSCPSGLLPNGSASDAPTGSS